MWVGGQSTITNEPTWEQQEMGCTVPRLWMELYFKRFWPAGVWEAPKITVIGCCSGRLCHPSIPWVCQATQCSFGSTEGQWLLVWVWLGWREMRQWPILSDASDTSPEWSRDADGEGPNTYSAPSRDKNDSNKTCKMYGRGSHKGPRTRNAVSGQQSILSTFQKQITMPNMNIPDKVDTDAAEQVRSKTSSTTQPHIQRPNSPVNVENSRCCCKGCGERLESWGRGQDSMKFCHFCGRRCRVWCVAKLQIECDNEHFNAK